MLDKYPEIFDEMYRALVSAGETAGLLPNTLDRQAKLLESLAKIKGQIKVQWHILCNCNTYSGDSFYNDAFCNTDFC